MKSKKFNKYLEEMMLSAMKIMFMALIAGIIIAMIQTQFFEANKLNPQKVSIHPESVK